MITLYSYPELSGVADNNGYGLKVFAFLRLAGVDFTHEHVFDASAAPRGQLPYIVDDAEEIGDSDTIIAHVIAKYRLGMDDGLTPRQRDTNHLILRMLDDLYWVMSYSRWKDERYWPLFLEMLRREHPGLAEAGLRKAQEFNSQRYYYQGIGRYSPTEAYARGLADLQVLANLISASEYVHGAKPTSIDAAIYGFIANIYFLEIDTPLKKFVVAAPGLVRHCTTIHAGNRLSFTDQRDVVITRQASGTADIDPLMGESEVLCGRATALKGWGNVDPCSPPCVPRVGCTVRGWGLPVRGMYHLGAIRRQPSTGSGRAAAGGAGQLLC